MQIFDCFMFHNEFDLLELRLKELYDYVDCFVIVESDLSFTCREKPYHFEINKKRYDPWIDKIKHVKFKSFGHAIPWNNEHDQRNAIMNALTDANAEDIVIISDVDEILNANSVNWIRQNPFFLFYGFVMHEFNFKFNFMRKDSKSEIIATATKLHWLETFSPQMLRNQKANLTKLPFHIEWQKKPKTLPLQLTISCDQVKILPQAGWHFSFLGDDRWLKEKAQNWSHQEDMTAEFFNQLDVEKSIAEKKCWNRRWPYQYEVVDLDSYFPASCRHYPEHCLPDSGITAQDLLKQHA